MHLARARGAAPRTAPPRPADASHSALIAGGEEARGGPTDDRVRRFPTSTSSVYADQEEVSTLKRKVEVLEEANKKLKAVETENAALKLKLAAISAGFK